ncbi:MFS transporter [Corynebacterium urealyticum]|uniref:MFS transporter n=1 Tax=Corynebacterium urealyticum TaxID=43771 RepID=UPI0021CCBF6B|nr:MFS transporter [Corynebacterium urealyticum]
MTYTLGIVLGTALSVALPRPWAYAAVIAVLLATAVPFLTRLLLMLAQAIALFFLLYYLRDRIGFHDPELGVLILTAVFAGCVVATALWSGWFSDKLGARKPFILFSATGVAGACAVLAFTSSFTAVVVGAVILGLSWGVYQAIDQALVNAVLPTEQERATHMGLINLAVLLPNTLAPSIAAIALSLLGGYTGLYLLAGAMCLAGGALVLKIQATR